MNNNIYEICDLIVKAVSESELIQEYCIEKFGKKHSVFLGIDSNNPPASSSLPMILIAPESELIQDGVAMVNSIFIGCAISDDSTLTANGITKFPGYQNIQKLEKFVFQCIENLISEKITELSILDTGEVRYLSYYPEYQTQRSLKIISERD